MLQLEVMFRFDNISNYSYLYIPNDYHIITQSDIKVLMNTAIDPVC